jgi:hypothetical protein
MVALERSAAFETHQPTVGGGEPEHEKGAIEWLKSPKVQGR